MLKLSHVGKVFGVNLHDEESFIFIFLYIMVAFLSFILFYICGCLICLSMHLYSLCFHLPFM